MVVKPEAGGGGLDGGEGGGGGVERVSTSTFLPDSNAKSVGLSLVQDFTFQTLVCAIFWSSSSFFFFLTVLPFPLLLQPLMASLNKQTKFKKQNQKKTKKQNKTKKTKKNKQNKCGFSSANLIAELSFHTMRPG